VQFEVRHELDAPVEAVERSLFSAEMGPFLVARLPKMESIEIRELTEVAGVVTRVTHVQARSLFPIIDRWNVGKDVMQWDEHFAYRRADRAATYRVDAVERFRSRIACGGTYALEPLPGGRTLRVIRAHFDVQVAILGPAIERLAISEVRAHYDAEAAFHAASFGRGDKDATVAGAV
jgi:hypothetical protein